MDYTRLYRLFKSGNQTVAAEIYFKLCTAISKEKALKQYPEFTKEIEKFITADPSGNLKYLDWQLKILSSGQALENEIIDVVNLFHKYSQFLKRKDLYSYKPNEVAALRDELLSIQDQREQKKQKREDKYSIEADEVTCGSETVFEDEEVKVLLIKNKAASVHYGVDTQWCVRLKDRQYFEDYDSNNVIFFFILSKNIPKDDPLHKVALSYQRDKDNNIIQLDAWDATDSKMSESECIKKLLREGVDNALEILTITRNIAKKQPKSLLSKINSGDISPEEAREAYNKEKNPEIRYQLADMFVGNSTLSHDELYELYNRESAPKVKERIAEQLLTYSVEPSLLRELHKAHPDLDTVYTNPTIPMDMLMEALNSTDVTRRSIAAVNPRIPLDKLIELSVEDPIARRALARREDTPPDILLKIVSDGSTHIALLDNPNTPTEALKVIIDDERFRYSHTAEKAIRHPNLTLDLLYKFVDGSNSIAVKNRLFFMLGKDYESFATACRDKKINLEDAEKAVTYPEGVDPMELHYLRRYVARNSTNTELLQQLLDLKPSDFINDNNGKSSMDMALLENPNLPEHILAALFPKHTYTVASHPKITDEMVRSIISEEKNIWGIRNLIKNQHLSVTSLTLVFDAIVHAFETKESKWTVKELLVDLLNNSEVTPELMTIIYTWSVQTSQERAVFNKLIALPKTPESIIRDMTVNSTDPVVKENAQRRLDGLI